MVFSLSEGISSSLSDLFITIMKGVLRPFNFSINSLSDCEIPTCASITTRAISVELRTFKLCETRISPSSLLSSRPAVSVRSTGPSGRISIAFETGSVVVPATLETTARVCEVSAFIRLDFPALVRPKMPICVLSPEGVVFKLIVFSKN